MISTNSLSVISASLVASFQSPTIISLPAIHQIPPVNHTLCFFTGCFALPLTPNKKVFSIPILISKIESSSRSLKFHSTSLLCSLSRVDCSTCVMKFWQYCTSGVGILLKELVCASSSAQAFPIRMITVPFSIAGIHMLFPLPSFLPFTAYTKGFPDAAAPETQSTSSFVSCVAPSSLYPITPITRIVSASLNISGSFTTSSAVLPVV